MNPNRLCWLLTVSLLFASAHVSLAQEGRFNPNDPNSVPPPPPGVDKFYWDLAHSQDRVTKSMAERYLNTIKAQEWSDLSGKFKTIARYVRHTPDLASVTIETGKGRGAERVMKEVTVPVDKLSKTCQSRVRQIDAMQKKLKELAAASKKGENGAAGAPMTDERGAEPGAPPAGPEAGTGLGPGEVGPPGSTPPATPEPDPSASEPDPLGFAELPELPTPGPEGVPGAIAPDGTVPGDAGPGTTPPAPSPRQ
jgi:hypothetical protein